MSHFPNIVQSERETFDCCQFMKMKTSSISHPTKEFKHVQPIVFEDPFLSLQTKTSTHSLSNHTVMKSSLSNFASKSNSMIAIDVTGLDQEGFVDIKRLSINARPAHLPKITPHTNQQDTIETAHNAFIATTDAVYKVPTVNTNATNDNVTMKQDIDTINVVEIPTDAVHENNELEKQGLQSNERLVKQPRPSISDPKPSNSFH